VISFLQRLMYKPPLPAKDPNDRTLTASSTAWKAEYFCDNCLASVGYDECLTDICNSCGKTSKRWPAGFLGHSRAVRELFDGTNWMWQYTYSNDEDFITKGKL
jgi:hypothetical protein